MVECGGLEIRCTARYRGFESLSLRNKGCKSASYAICALYYTLKNLPPNSPIFLPKIKQEFPFIFTCSITSTLSYAIAECLILFWIFLLNHIKDELCALLHF